MSRIKGNMPQAARQSQAFQGTSKKGKSKGKGGQQSTKAATSSLKSESSGLFADLPNVGMKEPEEQLEALQNSGVFEQAAQEVEDATEQRKQRLREKTDSKKIMPRRGESTDTGVNMKQVRRELTLSDDIMDSRGGRKGVGAAAGAATSSVTRTRGVNASSPLRSVARQGALFEDAKKAAHTESTAAVSLKKQSEPLGDDLPWVGLLPEQK